MTTDGPLHVAEVPSRRWDLAMEIIRDGGPTVMLEGSPTVGLQRWLGWPGADGLVHVYVWTSQEPDRLTDGSIQSDVDAALGILRSVREADPTFDQILTVETAVYEYLYDYGQGAAKVANFDEHGQVTRL